MTRTETYAQEQITTYFTRKGATTHLDGATLEARFPGDLTKLTEHMAGSLDAALGRAQTIKTIYYQTVIDDAGIHGYRNGDLLPWQHAVRTHGMPVIATHYPTTLHPHATTVPALPHISNSAELILPNVGPAMSGYQTKEGALLSIDIDAIESYATR